MGRLSVEEFKAAEKTPLTVVLDDVRSMYNVGSVLRSCDAFRVKEVLLCGRGQRGLEAPAVGAGGRQ